MSKFYALLSAAFGILLVAPSIKPAIAQESPTSVQAPIITAQANAQATNLSRITGQYVVSGVDADGPYQGVAWIQASTDGKKAEVHWSLDSPAFPGIENYVGVGALNAEGKLVVAYTGAIASGDQTFTLLPDGKLQATFTYANANGSSGRGTETFTPVKATAQPAGAR